MEDSLRYFGSQVDALIRGGNLTRVDASFLFEQILNNEQPDLQQGAFLAAITAKGATPAEIAGIWEAIYEIDTVQVHPDVNDPLVENCGTGMDGIKTFNISTAASLVAASDGITMAKHGARAIKRYPYLSGRPGYLLQCDAWILIPVNGAQNIKAC